MLQQVLDSDVFGERIFPHLIFEQFTRMQDNLLSTVVLAILGIKRKRFAGLGVASGRAICCQPGSNC